MLQREVVARMVAAPGDSDYGRLTVMLQYRFEMEKLLDISAAAFDPAPQVDSAVVRLLPRSAPALRARDERAFSRVVAAAFSQRRKTLRNSLANLVSDEDFEKVRIAPTARAQELSVAQFVALADGVAGAQSAPDAAHADLR
jgi:16S rRNA (adenine1518-N6/adenine1519-N6)-dimethyltransferase